MRVSWLWVKLGLDILAPGRHGWEELGSRRTSCGNWSSELHIRYISEMGSACQRNLGLERERVKKPVDFLILLLRDWRSKDSITMLGSELSKDFIWRVYEKLVWIRAEDTDCSTDSASEMMKNFLDVHKQGIVRWFFIVNGKLTEMGAQKGRRTLT